MQCNSEGICELVADKRKWLNENGYQWTTFNGKPTAVHRLVAALALGRELVPGEHVHHINHKRDDNRPANLVVMPWYEHLKLHIEERERSGVVVDQCAACGAPLRKVFGFCRDCQHEFGVANTPYREWPIEIKTFIREQRRDDRRHRHQRLFEVSLDEMMETGWELTEDHLYGKVELVPPDTMGQCTATRPLRVGEPMDMPYAPYEDEAANRDYRRACNIPERLE